MNGLITQQESITEDINEQNVAFALGNYTTTTLFNDASYFEHIVNQREPREESEESHFISPAERNFSIITAVTSILKNINFLIGNSTQNITELNQVPEETFFMTVGFFSFIVIFCVATCILVCFFELLKLFKQKGQEKLRSHENNLESK